MPFQLLGTSMRYVAPSAKEPVYVVVAAATDIGATAAAKAAYAALLTGEFPDPVEIALPRGERPSFALATTRRDKDFATAGIVKDAGDDPDVTHGALVLVTVRAAAAGLFRVKRATDSRRPAPRPSSSKSFHRVLSKNPIDALNAECLFGTGRDFRIGSQAAHGPCFW